MHAHACRLSHGEINLVACRAEPSARTKQAKLINSLTVCHSLKSILQLSLETFSSGSRHYRIILGWGETGWFTEKSVTMGSYLQIEGCASVKCILPPSLPPSVLCVHGWPAWVTHTQEQEWGWTPQGFCMCLSPTRMSY